LQDFPDSETRLKTEKGMAKCQKIDIFKGIMWFCYEDNYSQWHTLKVEQVREILTLNKAQKPVSALEDFVFELQLDESKNFQNVVGQDSLNRFDTPKKKNNRNKKRKRNETNIAATTKNETKETVNTVEKKEQNAANNQSRNNKKGKRNKGNYNKRNAPKKE